MITTKPATAPEQKPSTLGLPFTTHSAMGQTKDATAVASVNNSNSGDPKSGHPSIVCRNSAGHVPKTYHVPAAAAQIMPTV